MVLFGGSYSLTGRIWMMTALLRKYSPSYCWEADLMVGGIH